MSTEIISIPTFCCRQCNVLRPIDQFIPEKRSPHGHTVICRGCINANSRARYAANREKRRVKNREYTRKYRAKIPVEERRAKQRALYHANVNYYRKMAMDHVRKDPEKCRKRHREWSSRNKKQVADYARNRHQTNVQSRLRTNTNSRIRYALKRLDLYKDKGTLSLLGCTGDALARYLESRFKPGMTWENYGRWYVGAPMTWHIDHIRPCSSFDLTDPAQQALCFHYTNLQPLWAIDNLTKSDSYAQPTPTLS